MFKRLFANKSPKSGFDSEGRQILPKGKLAIPAGMEIPETLEQKLARMFAAHTASLSNHGHDSFEEYDDFSDEGDDPRVPFSGFEISELFPASQTAELPPNPSPLEAKVSAPAPVPNGSEPLGSPSTNLKDS